MRPDEAAAREHLAGGAFRLGLTLSRWREPRLEWPHLLVNVAAAERPGAPAWYPFRLELSNYPAQAPLGEFWDRAADTKLAPDRWPTGTPDSRPAAILRPDWALNQHGLYAAFDRSGISTHPDWHQNHPAEAWAAHHTLTDYLEYVHDLLASPDYTGSCLPWSLDLL